MGPKVYISGKLYDKADAKISVFDHGLLYGDGVFEGIRAYSGQRLPAQAARRPAVRVGHGPSTWRSRCPATRWPRPSTRRSRANKLTDAYIRVVVTRGAGSLGLDPRKTTDPQVIIITDTISLYPAELYEHGLKIITAGDDRATTRTPLNPRIKSLNYLNNIMAKIEGDQRRLPRSPDAQPQGRGRRVHRRQHLHRAAGRASTRRRSTRASSRASPATR